MGARLRRKFQHGVRVPEPEPRRGARRPRRRTERIRARSRRSRAADVLLPTGEPLPVQGERPEGLGSEEGTGLDGHREWQDRSDARDAARHLGDRPQG